MVNPVLNYAEPDEGNNGRWKARIKGRIGTYRMAAWNNTLEDWEFKYAKPDGTAYSNSDDAKYGEWTWIYIYEDKDKLPIYHWKHPYGATYDPGLGYTGTGSSSPTTSTTINQAIVRDNAHVKGSIQLLSVQDDDGTKGYATWALIRTEDGSVPSPTAIAESANRVFPNFVVNPADSVYAPIDIGMISNPGTGWNSTNIFINNYGSYMANSVNLGGFQLPDANAINNVFGISNTYFFYLLTRDGQRGPAPVSPFNYVKNVSAFEGHQNPIADLTKITDWWMTYERRADFFPGKDTDIPTTFKGFAHTTQLANSSNASQIESSLHSITLLPTKVQNATTSVVETISSTPIDRTFITGAYGTIAKPVTKGGPYNYNSYSYPGGIGPDQLIRMRFFNDWTDTVINIEEANPGNPAFDPFIETNFWTDKNQSGTLDPRGVVRGAVAIWDAGRQSFVNTAVGFATGSSYNEVTGIDRATTDTNGNIAGTFFVTLNDLDTNSIEYQDLDPPEIVHTTFPGNTSFNDPTTITVTFTDVGTLKVATNVLGGTIAAGLPSKLDRCFVSGSNANIAGASVTHTMTKEFHGPGTHVCTMMALDMDGNQVSIDYQFEIVAPLNNTPSSCNPWNESTGLTSWPATADSNITLASAAATFTDPVYSETYAEAEVTRVDGTGFGTVPTYLAYNFFQGAMATGAISGYKYIFAIASAGSSTVKLIGTNTLGFARYYENKLKLTTSNAKVYSYGYCSTAGTTSPDTLGVILPPVIPTPPTPIATSSGSGSAPTPGGPGSKEYHWRHAPR